MILIFTTQAAAAAAAVIITDNHRFPPDGETYAWGFPLPLADGRFYIRRPAQDALMSGVTGYTVADGAGVAPINEGSMPTTIVECLALRDRFTDAEMGTITVAASRALGQDDPRLQMLLDTMGAAVQLDLHDPRVQQGFAGLVAFGLLTAERAGVILAPVGLLPQPGVS